MTRLKLTELCQKLSALGFNPNEYESSVSLDENGCFELCMMSDFHDNDIDGLNPEDDETEGRLIRQTLNELGYDVLADSGSHFEGYSSWTPEPGDCRRLSVRAK
jgi:hypothetical protein